MRIRAIVMTWGTALGLAFCLGAPQRCYASDESLPGYVTYIVDDTIYIEIVGEHHLNTGDTGVIQSKGREAAYVKVSEVGTKYIYVQIISQSGGVQLASGDSIVFQRRNVHRPEKAHREDEKGHELDRVILGGSLEQDTTYQVSSPWDQLPYEESNSTNKFVPTGTVNIFMPGAVSRTTPPPSPSEPAVHTPPPPLKPLAPLAVAPPASPPPPVRRVQRLTPPPPPPPVASSDTVKTSTATSTTKDDFVALLVPISIATSATKANANEANMFHGRLREREIYQTVPSPASHSLQSRLDSDGSIDRLYASPWSATWSGNLNYLDGNTSQTSPDYERPRVNIYNAMMTRRMEDGGSVKLGRFLPSELPGLGFLDGGQLDHVFSPQWRMGGVLALRPDRITLDPTSKEPFMAAYTTTEQGTHQQLYYSGTMGMYHTIYRGKADELALLSDNRMDLGPKLNLFGSTQIDFNDGAARVHNGPRVTRLDVYGNSPVTTSISLRAGLSHFERPDIAVERDLQQGTTQSFDDGFWRYFVGANERLPWNFSLDEDLSTIHSTNAPTDRLWRITISRFGFFFLPRGQISVSVYNVTAAQGSGFGFQSTASTPIWGDALSLNLSSSSQYSTPSGSPKDYNVNDGSVRINWRISKAWNADFGVTQSYASGRATSTVGDTSLGYRW